MGEKDMLNCLPTDRKHHISMVSIAIFLLIVSTFGFGVVTSSGISDGEGSTSFIATSQSGKTITYVNSSGMKEWSHTGNGSYFGVSIANEEKILVGFSRRGYENCPNRNTCKRTGVRHFNVTNSGLEMTSEWSYIINHGTGSQNHDVEYIGNGSYIVADMANERIGRVSDNGAHWIWNASEYYDEPENPKEIDWLHINDVDKIDEERYLVSVRNANQILIVHEEKGVVDTINPDMNDNNEDTCIKNGGRLQDYDNDGNIICGDPKVMWGQHNPQWVDEGVVLVADSNNNRVVEFHKKNGKWKEVWELRGVDSMPFIWVRDADRLPNGNTLITDTGNNRVVEVTPRGSLVASYKLPTGVYEADPYPSGEYPAGVEYSDNLTKSVHKAYEKQDIPILSRLLHAAHFVLPVPHWITEIQVAAVLLSIIGILIIIERFVSHILIRKIRTHILKT